ncbi:hypothetical protein Q5P01_023057 [Channa striata]|uniref:Uncharacterized protein n=1 Tax=Channa striata TaxID=64152 RepID=A0AA88LKT0_CHASR|nr:hypothetical protein Q5P01_023057 [Channa striata]
MKGSLRVTAESWQRSQFTDPLLSGSRPSACVCVYLEPLFVFVIIAGRKRRKGGKMSGAVTAASHPIERFTHMLTLLYQKLRHGPAEKKGIKLEREKPEQEEPTVEEESEWRRRKRLKG